MNLRALSYFFLISLIILSCKKDGQTEADKPDLDLPNLTVTGFALNDTIRNTVKVDIKGSDSKGLKSLEIFVNDSLFASSPDTAFSVEWNTLKSPDGNYTVKMVATDKSGNKKELSAKVVVSNALARIRAGLLVGHTHDTSDYYITDSSGKLVGSAKFVKNQHTQGELKIYPKSAYTGQTINLMRVSKSANFPQIIEYFIGLKRGEQFDYSPAPVKYKNETPVGPIPATLLNIPAHDIICISSDRGSMAYPLPWGAKLQLNYYPSSKAFVQIENGNQARHKFFDLPAGVSELSFDLAKANETSVAKNITLPAESQNAYIMAYFHPKPGFVENYVLADKKFSGSTTRVFYPDTLKLPVKGIVQYSHNNINYSQYHYTELPDKLPSANFSLQVKKSQPANFEADMSGDFDYYRILFANKVYVPNDQTYTEILVYATPGNERFDFPNLDTDFGIPGFNLSSFKLRHVEFNKYQGQTGAAKNQLNYTSNMLELPGTRSMIKGSITFND
jgi:hypothetical protein